jgi:hypothetical protein
VREMRASAPLTIAIGTSSLPLPSGFLDPISLKDQYKCDVELRDPEVLDEMRGFDASGALIAGPISSYAIFGENLQFDMQSNVATTFSLIFYQQPAALSPTNTSNFLCTRYSQLFRAALLKHAYAFRQAWDESTRYAQELEKQFQAIEVMDDLSMRGLNNPEEYA